MEIIGLGFRPTEEELVDFYLKHRLLGDDPRVHVMTEIDLCDVEPWEVPVMLAKSVIPFKAPEWFFFSPVNLKYSNSKMFKRTTKCGFWKPTGKVRDVRSRDNNTVIGTKRILVFKSGRASKGVNSNWVIHEYHALNILESQNSFVICHLIKKPGKTTEGETASVICDEGESSTCVVSDYENQAIAEGVPSGGTFTGMETIGQAIHEAEKSISPLEQLLIEIEHDDDAYFKNEKNIRQTPCETMQTPCETMQTPCCETMRTPCCETVQTPCETVQTPCETMLTPCETMQTPCETMQISLETLQTLSETIQIPCEISFETLQIPYETTQISCETSHITFEAPFETTQTPLNSKEIPFETTQVLLELMNSLLADESLVTQSKSLKRRYRENSYIDADVVPELDASTEDISTLYAEYLNSEEYHSLKRFKTSYKVEHGDTHLFSGQEASQEKQESIFEDDFWGLDTSSCGSTINKPVEINCSEISSFPCT